MQQKVSRRVLARTVTERLLAEPARTAHWVKVLAAYLLAHNMAEDAELIVNDIAHELYVQAKHLMVDVTSARPLSETVRRELKVYLQKLTGAGSIDMRESIDPGLIGGLLARTPDGELDLSIRRQLRQLANLGGAYGMTKETIYL